MKEKNVKKKLLSLLLTLAVLISLFPAFGMTAFADGGSVTLIVNEVTSDDSAERANNAKYKTVSGALSRANPGDTIRLESDITGATSTTIDSGKKITLDLNGYVLKGSDSGCCVITNNGELTIIDSNPTAEHKFGDSAGCWKWNDDLTGDDIKHILKGGCITGGNIKNGGGIFNKGTLNVVGGNIVGNIATEKGGGIFNNLNSTVTLENCNIVGNTANVNGGGIFISKENLDNPDCFIEGTIITMADGSTKNIEDVKDGDIVRTFDHETGEVSTEKICFAYEGEEMKHAFTLHFTNSIDLSIVTSHALLEKSSLKYVVIDEENASDYVGKYFYNADAQRWEQLQSVSKNEEKYKYYAIYSANHINCVANHMISVVDDVTCFANVFDFDENLKINQAKKQADIEKYGLFIMDDDNDLMKKAHETYNYNYNDEILKKAYEDFNYEYLNVAIGKKLISSDEVIQSIPDVYEYYSAKQEKPAVLAEESACLQSSLQGSLIIGPNVEIQNNKAGISPNLVTNNVYLSDGKYITLADDFSEASVGIIMENPGRFSTNGSISDTVYFTSDKKNFKVAHNDNYTEATTDDYLELVVGAYIDVDGSGLTTKIGDDLKKSCYYEGKAYFESISEALSVANKFKNGGIGNSTDTVPITLTKDVKENIVISANQNIELDLNGYTLDGNITNDGILTIKDSSFKAQDIATKQDFELGTGKVTGEIIERNNGSLLFESGKFAVSQQKDGEKLLYKDSATTPAKDLNSHSAIINNEWIVMPDGMNLDFTLKYLVFEKDASKPASYYTEAKAVKIDAVSKEYELAADKDYTAVIYMDTDYNGVKARAFDFTALYDDNIMTVNNHVDAGLSKYDQVDRSVDGELNYTLSKNSYTLSSTSYANPIAAFDFKVNANNLNVDDLFSFDFGRDDSGYNAYVSTMDLINKIPLKFADKYEARIVNKLNGVNLVDYVYAPAGYQLAIIAADHGSRYTTTLDLFDENLDENVPVYFTSNPAYIAQSTNPEGKDIAGNKGQLKGVYLALVKNTVSEQTVKEAINNHVGKDNTILPEMFTGNINYDNATDYNDASIVYQMLKDNSKWGYDPSNTNLFIEPLKRLLCEGNQDGKLYGTIEDVNFILDKITDNGKYSYK